MTSRMNLVVAGHVDHGKSTIVGRLLVDTGSLPDGKLDRVRAHCARTARPFEYAFLLDALKEEQAQGITIDSARVFFTSATRQYIIIDAPGHVEFLKNMVSGAARAEAAFLVIDAKEGIRENSRRHGYLLGLLGIRQVAVLVNKMDLVGYDRVTYERIVREYGDFLQRVGVLPAAFVPVAGFHGENLVTRAARMPWYDGPTALQALDAFQVEQLPAERPFRMPVQAVYKFTEQGDDRRIVAGTIESGTLRRGDEVVFYPSRKRSRVRSIEAFHRAPPTSVSAGSAAGFTLDEQVYVTRGEIATAAHEPPPRVSRRLSVSLVWLGRRPLVPDREYLLKLGTSRVAARVETIHRVIDAADLQVTEGKSRVDRHDVADCVLALRTPIAFDPVADFPSTSRFVLVDDYEIGGGGIVRQDAEPLAPAEPATEQLRALVAAESRAVATPRPSLAKTVSWRVWNRIRFGRWEIEPVVVWLTGLSGAGKSTIAERVTRQLLARGLKVEHLDGDGIRDIFPNTGFTRDERDAHLKRVGYLASRLERHGVFVVASFVSPYAESRDFVRGLCRNFLEVHVATSLEECERRDVKGLYARARRGEIRHFTGIDDPYEPPTNPELWLDTQRLTADEATELVLERLSPRHARPARIALTPAPAPPLRAPAHP